MADPSRDHAGDRATTDEALIAELGLDQPDFLVPPFPLPDGQECAVRR